jgi:hypothetical protein
MWLTVMLLLALYCYKNRIFPLNRHTTQEALWTVKQSRDNSNKSHNARAP